MKINGLTIRRKQELLFLTALALLISSCASHRNLTLLRDSKDRTGLLSRSVVEEAYKIKVDDNLYVSIVSTNPELDEIYNPANIGNTRSGINTNVWAVLPTQYVHGYLVDKDGSITLPSIGKVHVLGLTISASETEIQAKANQYLKNVTAKVKLLNYKVTVIGEVFTPGVYYNYNPKFTVLDAISLANGTKNTAALDNILVLRQIGDKSRVFKLDLNSVGSLNSVAFNIQPNDVVIVQPSSYKDLELNLPVYTIVLSSVTAFLLVLSFIRSF
jgi:polysaccharide biosynthesis/export protein